jgi:hypothetical protein
MLISPTCKTEELRPCIGLRATYRSAKTRYGLLDGVGVWLTTSCSLVNSSLKGRGHLGLSQHAIDWWAWVVVHMYLYLYNSCILQVVSSSISQSNE